MTLGLEVDALGGQPGLYSARYAPLEGATDRDRRQYLLQNLLGKPSPWNAHFHCTVAIAKPEGALFFAEGNCPGVIIGEERGANGFGYDPIFFIPELGHHGRIIHGREEPIQLSCPRGKSRAARI